MNKLPRAVLYSVAAVMLLALAAPIVLAQGVPPPGVTVTLDTPSLELGASNSTTVNGTVSYSDTAAIPGGANDGNVDLAITAPEGWTATIAPASFTLADGQSADFIVTLVAPAAGSGAPIGDATLTATATSAGNRGATTTATIGLTRVDPPPPPVVPWYQTPIGIAGIVLAVLVVLGITGFVLYSNKQKRLAAERAEAERAAYLDRETGITVASATGPLQYGHKREIVYRLAVANTSTRPRVALLDVAEVTNGWRAATQVAKLPLSAGETVQTTLVVTPDAVITPGDKATVVVRVKPEEAREKDERLTLDVVAPKHGVPTDPHYKIVSVHREGAGDPVLRR